MKAEMIMMMMMMMIIIIIVMLILKDGPADYMMISINYGEAKICLKIVVGSLKGRMCLIGLRVSRRIILKWTLKRYL